MAYSSAQLTDSGLTYLREEHDIMPLSTTIPSVLRATVGYDERVDVVLDGYKKARSIETRYLCLNMVPITGEMTSTDLLREILFMEHTMSLLATTNIRQQAFARRSVALLQKLSELLPEDPAISTARLAPGQSVVLLTDAIIRFPTTYLGPDKVQGCARVAMQVDGKDAVLVVRTYDLLPDVDKPFVTAQSSLEELLMEYRYLRQVLCRIDREAYRLRMGLFLRFAKRLLSQVEQEV